MLRNRHIPTREERYIRYYNMQREHENSLVIANTIKDQLKALGYSFSEFDLQTLLEGYELYGLHKGYAEAKLFVNLADKCRKKTVTYNDLYRAINLKTRIKPLLQQSPELTLDGLDSFVEAVKSYTDDSVFVKCLSEWYVLAWLSLNDYPLKDKDILLEGVDTDGRKAESNRLPSKEVEIS